MASLDLAKTLNLPDLPAYLKQINQRLVKVAEAAGPELKTPLLSVVNAKSKRLRPSLLLASAFGAQDNQAVKSSATAIELLHLGSLLHDDIIDNSLVRWGQPTINSQNQVIGLLAGDYLLAQAGAQAAKISAAAARLIADSTSRLIQGESQEVASAFKIDRSLESYISCVEAKTGALIAAACALGGMCAKLSTPEINALNLYGNSLGISFQIVDDLLDILSTSRLMGKPVDQDAGHGTYTLPVLMSLQGNNRTKLIPMLKKTVDTKALSSFLIEDGSISESLSYIREYNQLASDALVIFDNQTVSSLVALPDAYLDWALKNLVAKEYQPKLKLNY